MFGLFKRKNPIERLEARYQALLKESFELSKTDRQASDAKQAEAQQVLLELEALRAQQNQKK